MGARFGGSMYKAVVRRLIRRNVKQLNGGNYGAALAMFHRDATLAFPGENDWSNQHRPTKKGRERFVTHRGHDEIEAFLQKYTGARIQMQIEDILVNGPPWNMRAAVRVHDWAVGDDGEDSYNNRAVLFLTVRWGKLRAQEDYEDTERAAAFDDLLSKRDHDSPPERVQEV
jgi:ketosteroid isomerase-like protein